MANEQESKKKFIDWGDGTQVDVTPPNLTDLPKVICPPECFPEGEDPDKEWGKEQTTTERKQNETKQPSQTPPKSK